MNSKEAITYILNKLENELNLDLTYHSVSHTNQVLSAAKDLAAFYEISENQTNLLLTAAAYHDSGFLIGYEDHEELGCQIANENLPSFGFNQLEIDEICSMIMATQVPQKPKNLLEKLLCDADLSYLSEDDYFSRANDLFNELEAFGKGLSKAKWKEIQVSFLKAHRFWTKGNLQSQGDLKKEIVIKKLLSSLNT